MLLALGIRLEGNRSCLRYNNHVGDIHVSLYLYLNESHILIPVLALISVNCDNYRFGNVLQHRTSIVNVLSTLDLSMLNNSGVPKISHINPSNQAVVHSQKLGYPM